MRMFAGGHGVGFGPGEELVGGDEPRPQFLMLLGVVGYALSKLVSMRQEEVHIESARPVEHLDRGLQRGALARIGSPDVPGIQIKRKFGGAGGLSHLVVLLGRTNVLAAFSLLLFWLVVKLFGMSFSP